MTVAQVSPISWRLEISSSDLFAAMFSRQYAWERYHFHPFSCLMKIASESSNSNNISTCFGNLCCLLRPVDCCCGEVISNLAHKDVLGRDFLCFPTASNVESSMSQESDEFHVSCTLQRSAPRTQSQSFYFTFTAHIYPIYPCR